MAKYYRRRECGKPEEMTREAWIESIRAEIMTGPGYYEHMFTLLGKGEKMIGSQYMYWMEWKD